MQRHCILSFIPSTPQLIPLPLLLLLLPLPPSPPATAHPRRHHLFFGQLMTRWLDIGDSPVLLFIPSALVSYWNFVFPGGSSPYYC